LGYLYDLYLSWKLLKIYFSNLTLEKTKTPKSGEFLRVFGLYEMLIFSS
jgi:hypothetical protein